MLHKKTKCKKIGIVGFANKISEWECPKCKMVFQCGDEYTEIMYCKGFKENSKKEHPKSFLLKKETSERK